MGVSHSGIWDYKQLLRSSQSMRTEITLGEGHTSLDQRDNLFFKREDQNPTGSVKDRGLAYQISHYVHQGHRNFVISSSGNAAISAAQYCQQAGCTLTAFVSPHTDAGKLSLLRRQSAEIQMHPRPIWAAQKFSREKNSINLRASHDPVGSVGYQTIAYELSEQSSPPIAALFLPVSSGTTLIGIVQGFNQLNLAIPPIHCVQTSTRHVIASMFDTDFHSESNSLASGLVAKVTPYKDTIISHINASQGTGWVVSNVDMQSAKSWLWEQGIETGYESACAVAGFFKAKQSRWDFPPGPIVCLCTGALRT